MNSNEDKYIKALKYAQERPSFTLQELVRDLNLDELEEKQFANQIHTHQIFYNNASNFIGYYRLQQIDLYFSVEDKFRLLEHEALQEARQNAVNSTRWATGALGLSIISLIVSASMSFLQLKSDVNLPKDFNKQLVQMQKVQIVDSANLQSINEKLSTIETIFKQRDGNKKPAPAISK